MHDFYGNAPAWGDDGFKPPHSDAEAKSLKTASVRNARVIHVAEGGAMYRDAVISGSFALADYQSDRLNGKLQKSVHVQVLWYGQKLKKQCPELTIDMSKATVVVGYTGRVVANVGSRRMKV